MGAADLTRIWLHDPSFSGSLLLLVRRGCLSYTAFSSLAFMTVTLKVLPALIHVKSPACSSNSGEISSLLCLLLYLLLTSPFPLSFPHKTWLPVRVKFCRLIFFLITPLASYLVPTLSSHLCVTTSTGASPGSVSLSSAGPVLAPTHLRITWLSLSSSLGISPLVWNLSQLVERPFWAVSHSPQVHMPKSGLAFCSQPMPPSLFSVSSLTPKGKKTQTLLLYMELSILVCMRSKPWNHIWFLSPLGRATV